jgi:hypothetical protein
MLSAVGIMRTVALRTFINGARTLALTYGDTGALQLSHNTTYNVLERKQYGAIYSSKLPKDLPHTCPWFGIREQSPWQARSDSASSITDLKS